MEHTYCRTYLKIVMEDVRKHVSSEDIKKAWTYRFGDGTVEFHGPEGYYHYGRACCCWEGRAQGWMAYLESKGLGGA